MDTKYWDKSTLYKEVDTLIYGDTFMTDEIFPISSINLAKKNCSHLELEELPLKDICGILHKGPNGTSIALNSNRSPEMQNFDCMHELIHYFFHDINYCFCSESDSTTINQNSILEWQANEGAAQALVPYQLFIPSYVRLSKYYAHFSNNNDIINNILSRTYGVSKKVISNRINSLEYAIHQYMSGCPVDKLQILSKAKIDKFGLNKYKPRYKYCLKCLSVVHDDDHYCSICSENIYQNCNTEYGVGYINYSGANTHKQNHCINDNCRAILCDNSRYCPFCSSLSSFFLLSYLNNWESEYKEKALLNSYKII